MVCLSQSFVMDAKVECIEDGAFEITAGINHYFATHETSKHFFMVFCGLLMDIMVLGSIMRFIIYGTSWRFLMAMGLFYGIRSCIQVRTF